MREVDTPVTQQQSAGKGPAPGIGPESPAAPWAWEQKLLALVLGSQPAWPLWDPTWALSGGWGWGGGKAWG